MRLKVLSPDLWLWLATDSLMSILSVSLQHSDHTASTIDSVMREATGQQHEMSALVRPADVISNIWLSGISSQRDRYFWWDMRRLRLTNTIAKQRCCKGNEHFRYYGWRLMQLIDKFCERDLDQSHGINVTEDVSIFRPRLNRSRISWYWTCEGVSAQIGITAEQSLGPLNCNWRSWWQCQKVCSLKRNV